MQPNKLFSASRPWHWLSIGLAFSVMLSLIFLRPQTVRAVSSINISGVSGSNANDGSAVGLRPTEKIASLFRLARPTVFSGCASISGIPQSECEGLVALYNSTNGPSWITQTGWLQDNTPCTWYGITCANGRVLYLYLEHDNLSGVLPPEIGNFPEMYVLDLINNHLTGALPAEIGKLALLQSLALYGNQLSGSLPSVIGDLSELSELLIDYNEFSGPIPASFGKLSKIGNFRLAHNHLSGEIPPELGNMSNCFDFQLENNQLSGPLPASLGKLILLQDLQVQFNQLSGELPSSLLNLTKMANGSLGLVENAFTATDPALLAYLNVKANGWNQWQTVPPANIAFASNNTDGGTVSWSPILYTSNGGNYEVSLSPSWLGPYIVTEVTQDKLSVQSQITGLTVGKYYFVRVRSFTPKHTGQQNDVYSQYSLPLAVVVGQPAATSIFSGCANVSGIPQSECEGLVALYNSTNGSSWITQTGWLQDSTPCTWYGITCANGRVFYLYLEHDNLSGVLPPEIGNFPEMAVLSLVNNQITGMLPTEIGKLAKLQSLVLQFNQLSGSLPSSIGDLSELREILLIYNQFSGPIPASLGKLSKLGNLRLAHNHLSGEIPPELGDMRNCFDFQLQDNQLSGALPASLGKLTLVQDLQVQSNKLSGELPTSLVFLTAMGNGSLALAENAFTATDPALLAYLNVKSNGWNQWQTMPSANITFAASSADGGTVSWLPILYTSNGGNYEVSVAPFLIGPYTVTEVTKDKLSGQSQITGLTADKNYFVRVRSFTPKHTGQQNDVYSQYSLPQVIVVGKNTATVTIKLIAPKKDSSNAAFASDFGRWWLDDGGVDDGDIYSDTKRFTIAAGHYEVAEKLADPGSPSWILSSITCDPSVKPKVNLAGFSVAFDVNAKDNITCTFANKRGSLGGSEEYEVFLPFVRR